MRHIDAIANLERQHGKQTHTSALATIRFGEVVMDDAHIQTQTGVDIESCPRERKPLETDCCLAETGTETALPYPTLYFQPLRIGDGVTAGTVVAVQVTSAQTDAAIDTIGKRVEVSKCGAAAYRKVLLLVPVLECKVQHIDIAVIVEGVEGQAEALCDGGIAGGVASSVPRSTAPCFAIGRNTGIPAVAGDFCLHRHCKHKADG